MKKMMRTKGKRICSLILALVLVLSVFSTSASAASTNIARSNVSNKAVTCNATDGSLPTGVSTIKSMKYYYYNLQVSSDIKLKKAELYIKLPGSSSYKKAATITANNYMRYAYAKYRITTAGTGTVKYYWKLTRIDGKTAKTSVKTVYQAF